VEKLEISGASSLTGLRVRGPVPADAKLSGLRDLRFFAVGGSTVTDNLIAPLQDCASLRTLTLAYPAVTADGLKKLRLPASIRSLSLPGAAVDDSVIAAWPEMPSLTHLDLRDTSITAVSLKRLLSANRATTVLLDRTKVSKDELGVLANHSGLTEVSLAGIGIDANVLGSILANGLLNRIDLSGSDVTPEILDVIAQSTAQLSFLGLRDCQLDEARLRSVAARHRNLRFDLSGSTASTELMTALLSARRIVDLEEWRRQQTMQTMYNLDGQSAQDNPAALDIHFFAALAAQTTQAGSPTSATISGPAAGVPIGNRIGQWLGGALFSPPTNTPQAADQQSPEEGKPVSSELDTGDSTLSQSSSEVVTGESNE
jgi:hypothetical protein